MCWSCGFPGGTGLCFEGWRLVQDWNGIRLLGCTSNDPRRELMKEAQFDTRHIQPPTGAPSGRTSCRYRCNPSHRSVQEMRKPMQKTNSSMEANNIVDGKFVWQNLWSMELSNDSTKPGSLHRRMPWSWCWPRMWSSKVTCLRPTRCLYASS